MNSPTGQCEALEVLPRRGSSQRKACRYLGLNLRISTYALKQSVKDRIPGERWVAASQELPYHGLVVAGGGVRTPSLEKAQAEHAEAAATPTALRQRYPLAGHHTA